VEGAHGVDAGPTRSSGEKIVNDETQLKEAKLAVRPGLLEESMFHRHRRQH
jgi:hypothetical protein